MRTLTATAHARPAGSRIGIRESIQSSLAALALSSGLLKARVSDLGRPYGTV